MLTLSTAGELTAAQQPVTPMGKEEFCRGLKAKGAKPPPFCKPEGEKEEEKEGGKEGEVKEMEAEAAKKKEEI